MKKTLTILAVTAITTIPAIIAQIFMIMAYREQWYFWLIIDIASTKKSMDSLQST